MDDLAGMRLVILGLARQGKALARFAAGIGAEVVISDMRSAEQLTAARAELADLRIEYVLGAHPMSLLDRTDVLAISGAVPVDAPIVAAAQARGIRLTNDSQEFMRRAPATVIGISGSAGKTTTTALTGVISQMAGRRTWVGGNIGRPLIADLHKMETDDVVVQELSSFQLEIWTQSPPLAAVLNITPNHLDRHKTMAAYAQAKANILRFQDEDGIAVLCLDDSGSRALQRLVAGRLRWFSRFEEVADGAFVSDNAIWLRDADGETRVCDLETVQLRGEHNIWNVLAAVTLADSAGLPVSAMQRAIASFPGVEHRLEVVATVAGVLYVNDSIATSPERALAALASFEEPVILLAGGKDKDMVWDEWAHRVQAGVKAVVLFGALAGFLQEKLNAHSASSSGTEGDRPVITQVETLADAVTAARSLAAAGDVVLLAPGGTSFDAFIDFAERGKKYRQLVMKMAGR